MLCCVPVSDLHCLAWHAHVKVQIKHISAMMAICCITLSPPPRSHCFMYMQPLLLSTVFVQASPGVLKHDMAEVHTHVERFQVCLYQEVKLWFMADVCIACLAGVCMHILCSAYLQNATDWLWCVGVVTTPIWSFPMKVNAYVYK